jgi:hypothetical protein
MVLALQQMFEGHGERLGHLVVEFSPLRGSTDDATTTLAQGAGRKEVLPLS